MTQDHEHGAPASQPAHIPDALVFDFDMFHDPGLVAEPHARVMELAAEAPPIFWTPRNGGHWMLVSYEANFEAARMSDLFSSAIIPPEYVEAMKAHMPPGAPTVPNLVPIFLDPPEHGKYRNPLASSFSPKTMNALQKDIRELARGLVRQVVADGQCEFMSAIATPLPVQVFLQMMGLPLDRMDEYRKLANEMIAGAGDPPQILMQRMLRILQAMRETINDRRINPRDDLVSQLWQLDIDGRAPTEEEVEGFSLLLFLAGLDTVMMAIGFAARHLAMDGELQQRLRADPSLIAEAKEEMLRRYSFVSPPRRITRDGTFLGADLKKNEKVVMFLPAAGLDPRRFDDPARFDPRRESKSHLAFNSGAHRCMGAHLARIELQIIYEELLAGLPQFSLDPKSPPNFTCGQNLGLASLDLVW